MMPNEFQRDRELRALEAQGLWLRPNADLTSFTSMRTRARCGMLAIPQHPRVLRPLVRLARDREWPLLMLGGGANTIFATEYFEGIVLVLSEDIFGRCHHIGRNTIRVGAGAKIGKLMDFSRSCGLMGLEFMTMIPGKVGGALAGNAGAGGLGLCDFVERCLVMTRSGRLVEVRRDGFDYGYRHSELSEAMVLEADFTLEPRVESVAIERARDFASKKKNQPYKVPSSGCIFKNPVDPNTGQQVSAGMLIDQCDMKGYNLNSVTVSDQHANFLVNLGNAAGEDFLAMISLIRDIVHERHGIELEVEARIVGGPLTSCVLR